LDATPQENKDEDVAEVTLLPRPEGMPAVAASGDVARKPSFRGAGDAAGVAGSLGLDSATSMSISRDSSAESLGLSKAGSQQSGGLGLSKNGSQQSLTTPCSTKVHLRFFSEPAATFSELSDDESDIESFFATESLHSGHSGLLEEMRARRDRDETDDDSSSRSGQKSQGTAHSPRSAYQKEDKNEDDDLLSDMPETESTCKKVKVMGARDAELVEENDTKPVPPPTPAPAPAPAPAHEEVRAVPPPSPGPLRSARTPASAPAQPQPVVEPQVQPSSGAPAVDEQPPAFTRESRGTSMSGLPPASASHAHVPMDADEPLVLPVVCYDISVRSLSDSSLSTTGSPSSAPGSPQTKSPSGSPTAADDPMLLGKVPPVHEVVAALHSIHEELPPGPADSRHEKTASMMSHRSSTGSSRMSVMTLVIKTMVEGSMKEVEFDFNLQADDPVEVAGEMVTELGIPEQGMVEIAREIGLLKEKELEKRAARQQARAMQRAQAASAVEQGPKGAAVVDTKASHPEAGDKYFPVPPEKALHKPSGPAPGVGVAVDVKAPVSLSEVAENVKPNGDVVPKGPASSQAALLAPPPHLRSVSAGGYLPKLPSQKYLPNGANPPGGHVSHLSAPTLPSRSSSAENLASVNRSSRATSAASTPNASFYLPRGPSEADEDFESLSGLAEDIETGESLVMHLGPGSRWPVSDGLGAWMCR
jgi:hypothetical protein